MADPRFVRGAQLSDLQKCGLAKALYPKYQLVIIEVSINISVFVSYVLQILVPPMGWNLDGNRSILPCLSFDRQPITFPRRHFRCIHHIIFSPAKIPFT
jgi:hypothetical protein